MTDIVDELRAIDHMSIEDCFLQSPLFLRAADEIERLRLSLSEARVEVEDIKAKLKTPAAVRLNWLRGDIDCSNILSEARATGRREGLSEAAKIADEARGEWEMDSVLWRGEGMHKTAEVSLQHSRAASLVAAVIRAAMEKEE